jgi:hypothetical protein
MSQHLEFHRHLKFQSGCYLDLTDLGSPVAYARSSRITDVGWNYIYAEDPAVAIAASKSDARGIRTLFFSSLSERELLVKAYPNSAMHEETWLNRSDPLAGFLPERAPFSKTLIGERPVPTSDFLEVFEGVLTDLGVGDEDIGSFQKQYGSSLRSARPVEGVSVRHLVGYVNGTPVACASIYFDKELACLYNVGAATNAKRHGYGSYISGLAVNLAFSLGVRRVFLQCASGGYVETMYRTLGFSQITDGTGFVDFA